MLPTKDCDIVADAITCRPRAVKLICFASGCFNPVNTHFLIVNINNFWGDDRDIFVGSEEALDAANQGLRHRGRRHHLQATSSEVFFKNYVIFFWILLSHNHIFC